jgi:hypothetical protein
VPKGEIASKAKSELKAIPFTTSFLINTSKPSKEEPPAALLEQDNLLLF